MSRCWGLNSNLRRCGRSGEWKFFCEDHRKQPFVFLLFMVFTVAGSIASIQSAWFGKASSVRLPTAPAPISSHEPALTWTTSAIDAIYDADSFAGIPWNQAYVDTILTVQNRGPVGLRDFDVVVALDTRIAGVGQRTTLPGVTLSPERNLVWNQTGSWDVLPKMPEPLGVRSSKGIYAPVDPTKSSWIVPSVRVRCDRIGVGDVLAVSLASITVVMDPKTQGAIFVEKQHQYAIRNLPKRFAVLGGYDTGYGVDSHHYEVKKTGSIEGITP